MTVFWSFFVYLHKNLQYGKKKNIPNRKMKKNLTIPFL